MKIRTITSNSGYGERTSVMCTYGVIETDLTKLLVGFIGEELVAVYVDTQDSLVRLKQSWGGCRWNRSDADVAFLTQPMNRFIVSGDEPDVSILLKGTLFQIKVWTHLSRIKRGDTLSYSVLARQIGCPGAARAVGTAVGLNPVSVLIPCHRVLLQSGKLGGYAWGVDIKRVLLEMESVFAAKGLAPKDSLS